MTIYQGWVKYEGSLLIQTHRKWSLVQLLVKCTHWEVCLYSPTPGKFWISANTRFLLEQYWSKIAKVGQNIPPFEPNLCFGKLNAFVSRNCSTRKCDSGVQTSAATCGVVNSGCGCIWCCAGHFGGFGAMNLGPASCTCHICPNGPVLLICGT